MPFSAKAVANFFFDLAAQDGKQLDPMKMQKLIYFAHGWHLALRGMPLLREHVEAWQYGPVVPDVYHTFKIYGGNAITSKATIYRLDVNPATGRQTLFHQIVPSLDDEASGQELDYAKGLITRVWVVYGSWTGVQLSQMTHEADGPWDVTMRGNVGRKGTDIPDPLIQEYFARKIAA